jgi:hypothetical protein
MIADVLLFLAVALVVGLAGLGLGMLLSRPLSRLADRALSEDDEPGDGRD